MNFTQEQMSEIFDEIANKKDGYRHLLKLSLESIMKAERNEFNIEHSDSSNGYRISSVFAHKSKLELIIPRSRHHNFYPLILALIKDQDNESKELAFELYRAGLTTEQVGDMFGKIYGQTYSKASISSMMQLMENTIIHQEDVKTVSISQVIIDSKEVKFIYSDLILNKVQIESVS